MRQHLISFIEFLQGLAPEGETPLIVRQKPKMQNGAFQHHADGAIKCTWPAALPQIRKIKEDQSWYGNTASFIVDRFQEGVPSAAAANCEYCLVMVLDDISTKSKTPPLEPTWKMETSEGNYQWGYAFDEDQPTKGEFSAAIKAIADAGYTDKGAINPVRNFRLPGSVNLKPGNDNFASKLVEFHPDRLFSLDQICEALGVTPGEADTAEYKPIRIKDTGEDDVFKWLSDNAMVLSKPNQEGWAGIICPNHEAHSDGNPEARYNPSVRAFCCLHAHCVDLDTTAFLSWVEGNGGPKRQSGIRDELLAATMDDALKKLNPSDYFSDDAKQIIAEAEMKQMARVEKSKWFEKFAYIMSDDSYFDLDYRREVRRSSFNALFRHVSCQSIHNNRRVEASICYDENRHAAGGKAIFGVTYAAGEDVMVAHDGEIYGNRWRDARPKPGSGDVQMWLDHCERLVPDVTEREHILDAMAYKVQNPKVKINHAILHGGDQGSGKDTMWAPFFWAVGGAAGKNIGKLDNDTLNSSWGYALESEVLILNELKEPEARERRALANKLKPIIAAPPDMLSINRKGLHPYDMVNRVFVMAFTNDPVPISIDSQDRRWFCVWSSAPRMDEAEAKKIWDWYKSGGFDAIAGWLHSRDVSAFNPAATPAWTEWKGNMVDLGMSMAESYLVDLIREYKGEFAHGVIAAPFHALCDRLAGGAPSGVKIPQAALLHALKEAGWIDLGRVGTAEFTSKKHMFAAREMAYRYKKSDLRRMVEGVEEAAETAKVIKMVK